MLRPNPADLDLDVCELGLGLGSFLREVDKHSHKGGYVAEGCASQCTLYCCSA